jgi:hypothetical protein
VGRAATKGLRALGHRGSMRGDPAKVLRGLGRFGDHRRRRIARAERNTSGGPRLDSGTGRARGRGWKTQGASWRDGEAAASLGRGWGAPELPAHDGAEALHGGASGRWR